MTTAIATLSSAKDVAAALASIGITPPAIHAIAAISRNCRDEFLGGLSACIANQDVDGAKRKFIDGLLACLADDVCASLTTLGFKPQYDKLVVAGQKQPQRFLSAVRAASDPAHENNAPAMAYLKERLADLHAPASTAPEAPAEAKRGQQPPAQKHGPADPVAAPQPDGQPTPRADASGAYRSYHVYGSGYALCFNAGEWDKRPGVMVDAAVSSGTKAYDWKNAVHIWLSAKEVAAVLAVFKKKRSRVEFSNHGAQNDKAFALEFQKAHFFCKVSVRKAPSHPARAVKILPEDAMGVAVLFMEQLLLAYPNVPAQEVLQIALSVHDLSEPTTA
jgi:hypothetical protein